MSIINAGCIGEGPCWEDLHPDEAAEIAWRIRAEENTIPIVDLNEIKPVQFNKTQVYDELNRINNGGVINPATIIKMLKQLHYIMTEYESLRFCVVAKDREIAELRERINIAEDALEKIDNMCDGDMCKFFDDTHHCSACRYLDGCQTGVAHAALAVIRGKGANNGK